MRGSTALQAVATLGLFALICRWLMESTTLPIGVYAAPSILAQIVYHARTAVIPLVLVVPALLAWRRLRWSALDPAGATRFFVFLVALIFGWSFSTYNTNIFFDQAHTLDRITLLVLTGLVLVHPAFAVLHVFSLMVILGQLNYPLPEAAWHYADKRLPLDALILFVAYLYVHLALRGKPTVYLFCVLCLVGAMYADAAILKMQLGPRPWSWLVQNDISNILLAAYKNGGWLSSLAVEDVVDAARKLHALRVPMAAGTLAVELAPLGLLVHPRATRWIPFALIVLHVLIWLASGIFFWKWIAFHCALIWYARRFTRADADRPRSEWANGVYRWRYGALSVALMLASRWFLILTPFAWADTGVSNFFVIGGVGESGATYRLEPRFFAPYDLTMQQSRFYYILPEPVLVGTFGSTDRFELAQRLDDASVLEISQIRREFGRVHFDESGREAFRFFVKRSVSNAMRREGRDNWLYKFAPPHHFQTTPSRDSYDFQEALTALVVIFEEWYYDGRTLTRTREVRLDPILIE